MRFKKRGKGGLRPGEYYGKEYKTKLYNLLSSQESALPPSQHSYFLSELGCSLFPRVGHKPCNAPAIRNPPCLTPHHTLMHKIRGSRKNCLLLNRNL